MKKYLSLLLLLVSISALWANNVITYKASGKLPETTDQSSYGLHTNAFNVAITSHEFADSIGTITFAGDVTSIGDRAFYHCIALTSISIPNSVTSIGDDAFEYCRSLTSITIPNSVTSISDGAFYRCESLNSITLSESLMTIGSYVFNLCKFTSIDIPASVRNIHVNTFNDCYWLASYNVNSDNSNYSSIDGVLFNKTQDTLISYPEAKSDSAYLVPTSVAHIGDSAFYECTKIKSITLPEGLKSIGNAAFSMQSEGYVMYSESPARRSTNIMVGPASPIHAITCEAIVPPVCKPNSFCNIEDTIPVYVPFKSLSAYKSADVWKEFTNIKAIGCDSLSGMCGENLTWQLTCDGVFTITGSGKMYDYSDSLLPWNDYLDQIIEVYDYRDKIVCDWIEAPNIEQYHITCMADTGCLNSAHTVFDIFVPFEPDFSFIHYNENVGTVELRESPSACDEDFVLVAYPKDSNRYALDYWLDHGWTWEDPQDTNIIHVSMYDYKQRIKNPWDTMYVAFKQINTFKISATCNSKYGYVTQSGSYWLGDTVKLTAVPTKDFAFKSWTDGNTDNPRYVIVKGDATYTAEFIGKCGDNLYWTIKDSTLVITGTGDMWDLNTSTYYGEIHSMWNSEKDKIRWVEFPKYLTSIGNSAFYGCSNLREVVLPALVRQIGSSAFALCPNLTSVNLPESVDSLGNYVFCGSNIQEPVYNSKIFAFLPPSTQGDYSIPEGIETLAYGFLCGSYYYNQISSLTIPQSVTTIIDYTDSCFAADVYDYRSDIGCDYLRTCEEYKYYVMTPQVIRRDCDYSHQPKNIVEPIDCSKNSYSDTTNYTICQGDTLHWQDREYTQSGVYSDTLIGMYGCDSIVTLHLSVLHSVTHDTSVTIFIYELPYLWEGQMFHSSGIYSCRYATSYGCDSIVFLKLQVIDVSTQCGENLYWQYSDGLLTIYGTGAMYDFTEKIVPWLDYRDSIQAIVICNGATHIGDYAFYGLSALQQLEFPSTVQTIGQYAVAYCDKLRAVTLGTNMLQLAANVFAGNAKLYDITCYTLDPPTADNTTFANYRAYLHIPCDAQRWYNIADVWYQFTNIECIGAETTAPTDSVITTPSDNSVVITWPTDEETFTYDLYVYDDQGTVVCILSFDAHGTLTGINYPSPSRGGATNVAAEEISGGYRFTITGLDPGTNYTYAVVYKDEQGTATHAESGTFTTKGSITEVGEVQNAECTMQNACKFLHNGRLVIMKNGHLYNAQGGEVK